MRAKKFKEKAPVKKRGKRKPRQSQGSLSTDLETYDASLLKEQEQPNREELSKEAVAEVPIHGPYRKHKEPLDRNLPYMLGRHPDFDERSHEYAITQLLLPTKSIEHITEGYCLSQGSLGACTGFAAAHALNTGPLRKALEKRNLPLRTDADARDYYAMATVLDGFLGTWPPTDSGSSTLGVCKSLKKLGLISRYEQCFGVSGVIGTITFGPLLLGIPWYDNFFFPDKNGLITPKGRVAGGHEVAIKAYKITGKVLGKNLIGFRNSWGLTWGVKGDGWMTVDTLAKLLSMQGDAFRLVA